jgi:hypothetical protein
MPEMKLLTPFLPGMLMPVAGAPMRPGNSALGIEQA